VEGTLDARLLQPAPLPGLPKAVGLGVPSTLARRRPDIRAAEAQLHAATASVGIAVANFYPDVSLTGNLGIRALDASYLTRWASHFYSAGPSVSLPIFEGGRLTAGLRMARAQMAESALSYRAIVLNALREVEDSLVSFRADRIERDRLAAVLASAQDTFHLASSLYTHGLSQYLQVLDAQRTVESAHQQLVQEDMTLANDVVGLYRALGGGWEQPGAKSDAPDVPGAPPVVPAAADALAAPE
jgi:multidrug efflux system outer membrane protein